MREDTSSSVQSTKKNVAKATEKVATNNPKNIFYISYTGDRKMDLNDQTALGKIIEDNSESRRKIKYFIKVNANNNPFNPYDKSYEVSSVALGKRMGKVTYTFLEVRQRAFDLYTTFLKTRQNKCLLEAQGAINAK